MAEPRRRHTSLRVRIVLAATAVVAVALLVGAALFVVLLQGALRDGVRASAEQDAASLASRVEASGLAALPTDDDDDDDESFFQVIDDSGAIVAASENAAEVGPLVDPEDAGDDATSDVSLPDDGGEFLAVADDAEDLAIVAGRSLEGVSETTATVTGMLAVAVPLLLGLVALTTWFVVGRALRPVERMRREVDDVTSASLDRRIADPGTSDEIGRLAATMNRMLDRLDASQRSQRRFISDASHELRSPLASMRQYAEVARAHPDQVRDGELAEVVLDEGARLERLVQGMLVLAKADERTLTPARVAVDLDDLVLAEARRLKDTSGLRVDTSRVGPARVLGDRGLLGQGLRNLADNAARHASGTVQFELTETDGHVLLAVFDDGDGIPADLRDRVFERFVRLDEGRARESGGSGLGLAIVREIAAAHGGSVVATASTLGGARFEVRLPASDSPS